MNSILTALQCIGLVVVLLMIIFIVALIRYNRSFAHQYKADEERFYAGMKTSLIDYAERLAR